MGVRNIKKQLAGVEDLLLGEGTQVQERNSGSVPITKINLVGIVDTVEALATLDITKYTTAIVKDLDRGGTFEWSATGTANGGTVFAVATGYWIRQYSGAINVKWFGAKGDGVTDDTVAIQSAMNTGDVIFDGDCTYLISSILVPDNTNLTTYNSIFKSDGLSEIIVEIQNNSKIDNINITADTQIANTSSMTKGAVKITGSYNTIGTIRVNNFDFGVVLYGATYTEINNIYITNYVRGILNRNSSFISIRNIDVDIKSVNARQDPGHNGLLVSSGTNLTYGTILVKHSGEHGIRFGGAYSGEEVVKYVDIESVSTVLTGQCGFKINPDFGQTAKYFNIGRIHVIDCAYGHSTGTNNDGVRIQKANKISIGEIIVDRELKGYSCNDGVFIDATIELNIDSVYVNKPLRDGVHIQDYSADNPAIYSDVNNIFINNLTVVSPSNNGVYITSTINPLRFIIMPKIIISDPLNNGIELLATNIRQPCIFNGYVYSPANYAYTGVESSSVYTNIQCDTIGKSIGLKTLSTKENTLEQKTPSTNGNYKYETLFIQGQGTEEQGNYGGGIGFSGAGSSDRRRAAIMARQTGANAPQVGLEFWVHNGIVSSTNGLDRAFVVNHDGSILSNVDNICSIGSSSNRWSVVYAGTGTINTSDDREKTYIDITEAEKQVAIELKANMKKFKFNDAIESKGEKARIHFGASAQTVKSIFEKYGLNGFDYAILCYDEWEEQEEVKDEEGNIIEPYRPAGDRYGIRYEELLCFIISAM